MSFLKGQWRIPLPVLTAALICVVAMLLPPQTDAAQDAPPNDTHTLIAYEYAGGAALFADPADSGLREALSQAPARLQLLTRQFNQMGMVPKEAINVVCALLSKPHQFVVTFGGMDPDTGAPDVGIRLTMSFSDAGGAASMRSDISSLLTNLAGLRLNRDAEGADEFMTPLGAGFIETQARDGGSALTLRLGMSSDDPVEIPGAAPANQSTMLFRGLLDLSPFADMIQAMGAGDPNLEMFEAAGLMNGLRARQTMLLERNRDGLSWKRRTVDMRTLLSGIGMGDEPLENQDLRVVPANAIFAWMASVDVAQIWDIYATLALNAEPEIGDTFEQFELRTGVDVRRDVIGSLGSTAAVYMSDSTGAGGLLSVTGVMSLADTETFSRSLRSLINAANAELARADIPGGAIQIQRWTHDDLNLFSLRFPGLPVPFEPTWAIAGDWFVVGATPQGAVAAALQATRRGDLGLPTNRSFKDGRFETPSPIQAVTFIDLPRSIRSGYGLASLLGVAIANSVRPEGEAGDSTLVIPPYLALAENARAFVNLSYWDGDDWVSEGRTDGSIIANGAGAVGAAGGASATVSAPLMVGILLPAMGRAQRQAEMLKDGANLKQIAVGVVTYAQTNKDIGPESLDELVEEGFLHAGVLKSSLGDPDGGGPDYFLVSRVRISFDSQTIMGYSRSSYSHLNAVNVVFCDGHVESLLHDDFHRLIRTPKNRGTDWDLPKGGGDKPPF